ncbi:MAG: (NiFe) hydrogenase maturation protein HypF [candidate division Zixibacteria bacterium RBG-1]|nr:MAG: (NiFe) hydrogenase maturation protein HypF [candidate division Zixibacteria bacterium RBG-1]
MSETKIFNSAYTTVPDVKAGLDESQHWRLLVKGTVQGVGFRPFVFRLAKKLGLTGRVYNNSTGVIIDLEGKSETLEKFLVQLKSEKPPASTITEVNREILPLQYCGDFQIQKSAGKQELKLHVPADIATCPDCEREIFDFKDKRYEYPFTNCTNCGPRYTIIRDLPYDRPYTSMADFKMCPECQSEYENPNNRRFHAQPNACPRCGPNLGFVSLNREESFLLPLEETIARLKRGEIIAVKGIGGFHLACDAKNPQAVKRLRERKKRTAKPFAIMAKDCETIQNSCEVTPTELQILQSSERPIVLLRRKKNCPIVGEVAPNLQYLGVMLPYTPLHHLLLKKSDMILVMTSANNSEEPILYRDEQVLKKVAGLADGILTHNRKIERFCDDSVVSVILDKPVAWRRSRGFAPKPLMVKEKFKVPIFAAGGHFKNTFGLARENDIFISPHIGDLENLESYQAYQDTYRYFQKLFEIKPEIAAFDLHPEYLATKFVQNLEGVKKIGVQHHEAHIASCMAEHGLSEPVIGVAFDGTGLGWDGRIWGGEFLVGDSKYFQRVAHLKYLPLPGGEAAILRPAQMSVSFLWDVFGEEMYNLNLPLISKLGIAKTKMVVQMLQSGLNSPLCSSLGRIFDAVSLVLNYRAEITYEGEAAVALEMLANGDRVESYPYILDFKESPGKIDLGLTLKGIIQDLQDGVSPSEMADKFHTTIIEMVSSVCLKIKKEYDLNRVCLSGGCFMNRILLEGCYGRLSSLGFEVYFNSWIPINDGGLSVGQAIIANQRENLCA